MKKLTVLNKSILTALSVALCVVLPMTLHAIPKGGVLFSPMHLPVLLCGLVCGAPFGLVCGILGPLVSSLLTGMPVFGYMPVMMIELGLYGLISGLVMQFLRSGKLVVDLYAALVIAMLGGRVITGILRALIFAGGSYSWSAWATGYFVSCLPRYHYPADSDPHHLCCTGTRSSPAGSLRCCFCCRRDRSCINPYTLEPAGSSHHSKMAPLSYDRRAIFCL
ncbi:ECF transporter S component [Waltera sp.]|uniref:ECF transporter S component n=1 Tax=Waltera sp. TaxID=2815806 RepID=UPI0039A3E4BE